MMTATRIVKGTGNRYTGTMEERAFYMEVGGERNGGAGQAQGASGGNDKPGPITQRTHTPLLFMQWQSMTHHSVGTREGIINNLKKRSHK